MVPSLPSVSNNEQNQIIRHPAQSQRMKPEAAWEEPLRRKYSSIAVQRPVTQQPRRNAHCHCRLRDPTYLKQYWAGCISAPNSCRTHTLAPSSQHLSKSAWNQQENVATLNRLNQSSHVSSTVVVPLRTKNSDRPSIPTPHSRNRNCRRILPAVHGKNSPRSANLRKR